MDTTRSVPRPSHLTPKISKMGVGSTPSEMSNVGCELKSSSLVTVPSKTNGENGKHNPVATGKLTRHLSP